MTDPITTGTKGKELPFASPIDGLELYGWKGGKDFRTLVGSEGGLASFDHLRQIELAQAAGMVAFATKALLDAYTTGDKPLALVTNDDVDPAANNGVWRWVPGIPAWVKSADRVTVLEGNVAGLAATSNEHAALLADVDSPNLLNPDAVTLDVVLDSGLGTTSANVSFFTTDYIRVQAGSIYAFNTPATGKIVAFYGADKAYLSQVFSTGTFAPPDGAVYVRISLRYSDTAVADAMVVPGTSLPESYQPFGGVAERRNMKNMPGGYAGLDVAGKIDAAIISSADADSPNLFDKNAATGAVALVSATGETTDNTSFFTTDFISVDSGEQYAFSPAETGKFVCQYDGDHVFISTIVTTSEFTPVSGAEYVRISMRYTDVPVDEAMVVKGVLPSEYAAYGGNSLIREKQRNQPGGFPGLGSDRKIRAEHLPGEISGRILDGKKIAGLGDSITYGFIPRNAEGYPGQLQSWLLLVSEKLGAAAINYGISGSTVGDNGTGGNSPFTHRYADMDDAADLIIVMGGTNDVRKGVPLGAMGDTTDLTFYGALNVLCQGLLNKYRYTPGTTVGASKKIMFMTPIKLLSDGSPDDLHPNLPAYCDAIKQVCAYYGIPVFDAYNLSGLTPHLFRTLEGTEVGYTDFYNPYVTDGTHPTQEGHQIFADAIAGFIRTLY